MAQRMVITIIQTLATLLIHKRKQVDLEQKSMRDFFPVYIAYITCPGIEKELGEVLLLSPSAVPPKRWIMADSSPTASAPLTYKLTTHEGNEGRE